MRYCSETNNVDKKRKREWTAIPAQRSSLPVLKIKLYGVIGVLLAAALLGPLTLFLNVAGKSDIPLREVPDFSNVAAAKTILVDWLSAKSSEVTVAGEVSSFDRFNNNDESEPLNYREIDYLGERLLGTTFSTPHEIHSFLVTPEKGSRFIVDITLWVTEGGPVLATSPSIRPYAVSEDVIDSLDYIGEVGTAQDGISDERFLELVGKWAEGFLLGGTEGSEILSGVVNDGTLNGVYTGLTGDFELVDSPEILSWVPDTAENLLYNTEINFGTEVGYARVRLLLSSKSAKRWITSVEYDLLVTNLGESNPRIVAWGPGGSAPLQPFSNRKMD